MENENPLTIKFNLVNVSENLPVVEKKNQSTDLISNTDYATNDFNETRKNLLTILNIGTKAVEELGDIATRTQSPEPYEALAKLIKSMTEGSERVLQIHKQLSELQNNITPDVKNELHNHLHISTQELARALRQNESIT